MFGAYPCGTTNHAPTDSYYTGATNYATRIYLAEGATDEEWEEVIGQNMGVTLVGMMIGLPLGIWTLGSCSRNSPPNMRCAFRSVP